MLNGRGAAARQKPSSIFLYKVRIEAAPAAGPVDGTRLAPGRLLVVAAAADPGG